MGQKKAKPTNGALIQEIHAALTSLGGWGSLEIYVQNWKVTQITKREIKKTSHDIPAET